jgi:hypothetical protein
MIDSVETLEGKANTAIVTVNGVESLWFYGTLIGVRARDGAYHVQRDGEAGSTTTGKHLNTWVRLYGRKDWKCATEQSCEDSLKRVLNTEAARFK